MGSCARPARNCKAPHGNRTNTFVLALPPGTRSNVTCCCIKQDRSCGIWLEGWLAEVRARCTAEGIALPAASTRGLARRDSSLFRGCLLFSAPAHAHTRSERLVSRDDVGRNGGSNLTNPHEQFLQARRFVEQSPAAAPSAALSPSKRLSSSMRSWKVVGAAFGCTSWTPAVTGADGLLFNAPSLLVCPVVHCGLEHSRVVLPSAVATWKSVNPAKRRPVSKSLSQPEHTLSLYDTLSFPP